MSSISMAVPDSGASAPDVSTPQLYLLRAAYLILVLGLGSTVWPAMIAHTTWTLTLSPWRGVGNSLLAALGLLATLGLRYPLKMLPLLFFEVTWKTIWLIAVALPLWRQHGAIDADMAETIRACFMGVVFLFLIPWRYVYSTLVQGAGDRWRSESRFPAGRRSGSCGFREPRAGHNSMGCDVGFGRRRSQSPVR